MRRSKNIEKNEARQNTTSEKVTDMKADIKVTRSHVEHIKGALKDIKQLKEGPSLVAISKFLHFWNPRLFVIFDSEVVENWVFRHKYLADQLNSEPVKSMLDQLNLNNNSRLTKYFKALVFASDLISNYPHILETFASKVHNDIGTYEATAAEWFLLGLVELPPAGIEVSD